MQTTVPPKRPPFCPNPGCPFHNGDKRLWRYVRNGSFHAGRRQVSTQRYKCLSCRRSFSDRTFAATYWLRRPQLLRPIAQKLVSCCGIRQIAREVGCSPQTVVRHARRLGRQALLFHELHRPKARIEEPLALDSFVSFEWSQYYPSHYHVLVGRQSHYVYGFTESEVRRGGTMTLRQKRRREALEAAHGRPHPRSIERDVAALLSLAIPPGQPIELTTDEHKDYRRAVQSQPQLSIRHTTISSRAARTPRNPLFAVNLLDLLIRHSSANHKRETIAFSKRRQSAVERMWLFLVWRNYAKSFSEKRSSDTPAQRAGLAGKRWDLRKIFRRRLFPARIGIPARWRTALDGLVTTRPCGATAIRSVRFAF